MPASVLDSRTALTSMCSVDPDVPRAEVIRLSAGATPAKLARVLALLTPPELGLGMAKLRGRRTPSPLSTARSILTRVQA